MIFKTVAASSSLSVMALVCHSQESGLRSQVPYLLFGLDTSLAQMKACHQVCVEKAKFFPSYLGKAKRSIQLMVPIDGVKQ
jgi:hypothetical protein